MTDKYCNIFMTIFALLSIISIPAGNVTLGIATLTFLLYIYKNKKDLHIIDKTYYLAIAVFMGAMLISALTSGAIGQGMKRWSDFWLWRLIPFFIITFAIKDSHSIKRILAFSITGITLSALCAIYEGIGGDTRANGFFGHPMTLAGYLCLYMPTLFILLFEQTISNRKKWIAGALFVICAMALLFNATRGAWLAVAIAICLLLLYYISQKKKLAIFILCGLFAVGAGLSQYQPFTNRVASITDTKNQSNAERFLIWNSALHMFEDHPILGVGLGQYKDNYQKKYISPEAKEPKLEHAHNNFMQMLAESGIVGFAGFLTLISCFIGYSFKRFWKEKNPYALMMCASTLALILQGLTEYNFGNSAVMKCFWLLQGCLLVLSKTWKNDQLQNKEL